MRLFDGGVVSVLVFGCEVWMLNDATMASLRGWCARCVSKVTGRSIREECVDPTYPLVLKVRARRLRWLGHILRSHEGHLVRRVLMAQCQQCLMDGAAYPVGSIMMDAPPHESMAELVEIAEDRSKWRGLVHDILADAEGSSSDSE
jgi:hypothetical protein